MIVSRENGAPVVADSDEFFIVAGEGATPDVSRESRSTVLNISLGRLEAAAELRADELIETQAQWLSRDQEYFSLRLNERGSSPWG